jgi:DNA-binding CsgD family transcriptional regulator
MLLDRQYDRFVALTYEAAYGGHDRWQAWIDELARAFDLWSAHLVAFGHASQQVEFFVLGGRISTEAHVDYMRFYRSANPQLPLVMAADPGRWIRCHEYFDDAYVESSPFYRDYLIPHGGRYLASTKLIDDERSFVHFGTVRGLGQPPLDDAEVACLARVCHHLRHAFMIRRGLLSRPAQMRLGVELLDRLAQPLALLGRGRELRYLNPACERLFADLGERPGTGDPLPLFARGEQVLLDTVLADLLGPGPATTLRAGARRVLRLAPRDGQPLVAIASVLEPAAVMSAFGNEPLALLMFHRPGRARHIDPVVVAEAFGLTPAEARVAVLLANGLNAEQIAAERNASLLTVRTQIRSILAKTGVRRQPELVRMLVDMPEVGESARSSPD